MIMLSRPLAALSMAMIENAVISWDDIPYAKPPIGDLRWRAPQDLDVSSH